MSELIYRATKAATLAHKGQVRKYNGFPYILHPMRVAARTGLWCIENGATQWLYETMVAAAWLHDVIEDCEGWTEKRLYDAFGGGVASMVIQLTNPSKDRKDLNRSARKAMDREHIARAQQPVQVIKLIDRIDNLSEMQGCGDKFLKLYMEESRLLLAVLAGTDAGLEAELARLC